MKKLEKSSKPISATSLVSGESLRVGIGVRPDVLEPSQVTNSAVANLLEHVVETLVTVDENGRIAPRLAESWEVSADGREFTFSLPRGVTFQDGAPLDAEAVVWNVNRLTQINLEADCPVVAAELSSIQSVQALDESTVRFSLSRPLPNFLATLSWIAWGVLSPGSEKLPGNTLRRIQHPVGTGPFTFSTLSTDQLELSRFDGYRGQRPYFSKLLFKLVSSTQERESALINDQLDVILLPSTRQFSSFARDTRFATLAQPSLRTIFVNLNNLRAPFNDVRVRRAVNLAVDKQALIDKVLLGAGRVMDSPVAPSVLGYCPLGTYGYDPEAAKALLAEAGVQPGTPLTMLTPRGRYLEDVAVANGIARYLGDVGFRVTVEPLEWPAFMGSLFRPPDQVRADMHLFGWAPTFPDAGWQLPQLYDSKKWPPFGPASSFYRNPKVDEMLNIAYQTLDLDARADLFCQISRIIWDDAPAIFLWVQGFPVAYRAGLTNIVSLPNEKISLAFAQPTTTASAQQSPKPKKPK